MKGFREYTRLGKAQQLVLANVRKTEPEILPFQKSMGRVLFEDTVSGAHIPPFDRSAVDGFAVVASDTFGASPTRPARLKVTGAVRAGILPRVGLKKGQAVKVMTGAPLPKGADAVMMVEHTKTSGKILEVFYPITPGKNVSEMGEDVRAGETVLKAGKVLQPHDVGMLAAMHATRVNVFRRPRVAIVATGEELVKPGSKVPPAKIIDSNTYSLAAAVEKCGAVPHVLGVVPDDVKAIERAISRAVADDMVLVSGGSSVGEFDLVPDAISRMGILIFHGVSIRPGGPTAFGVVKKKPVFSLAGFPVATLVAFHFIARPALMFMQGLPPDHGLRMVQARLTKDVSSTLGRSDVVRVKLKKTKAGIDAEPIRVTGSSILSSMTGADGLVVIPENLEGMRKGETVEVELF
jgi:molybdenum cofactor synthesis domain-containing protein